MAIKSSLLKYHKLPLVSVCIPTYNGAQFLKDSLNSIKSQTYKNIEVVVSDDNSQDKSLEIIKKFKLEVDFPIYIYDHLPSGIGANWNNCIRKANGKFIKFLFQDDILYPSCIEEMIKIADCNKVGLVCSKRNFLVEDDVTEEIQRWMILYKDLQKNLNLTSEVSFLDHNFLKHKEFTKYPYNKIGEPTAVLFPKKLAVKVGCFREDLHQILDYEFYYRILKYKKIAIVDKELVGFRLHPMQATNINRNKPIKDYDLYEHILFKEFFWYLSWKEQKRLLKKFRFNTFTILKKVHNILK